MMHDGPGDEQKPERVPASGDAAPLKLEDFLPYRLNVVANLTSQALSRIYADRYGIGVPEWRVLVTLGQYGVMTGKQRAVALLETRGLLARRVNRADLREAFLSLTAAGRAIYEDLAPVAIAFAERLSEVLDPADRAAFDRALKRLTERSAKLAAESIGGEARKSEAAPSGPASRVTAARSNRKEDA
jgi:hypothetical protein